MSDQMSPDDETSPLLGQQRADSLNTLAGHRNIRKADNKELDGRSLGWILAAVWSAMFLSALDGKVPYRPAATGMTTFVKPQGRLSPRYSPQ